MSESPSASRTKLRQVLIWGAVALVIGGAFRASQRPNPQAFPPSIASGNGRLEATDTDIATKTGGRVLQVLVREGDNVKAGQTLVIMDTAVLEAELARPKAQVRQAQQASTTAEASISRPRANRTRQPSPARCTSTASSCSSRSRPGVVVSSAWRSRSCR